MLNGVIPGEFGTEGIGEPASGVNVRCSCPLNGGVRDIVTPRHLVESKDYPDADRAWTKFAIKVTLLSS